MHPVSAIQHSLLATMVCSAVLLAACGGGNAGTPAAATPLATGTATAQASATPAAAARPAATVIVSTAADVARTPATTPPPVAENLSGPVPTADDDSLLASPAAEAGRATAQSVSRKAEAGPGSATLSWKPSKGAAGYRVYYGGASRDYIQALGSGIASTETALTLTGLAAGQTYFFSVTAVDSSGHETAYSDETTKLVS